MEIVEQPLLSFLGVDIINVNFAATAQMEQNSFDALKSILTPRIYYPANAPLKFNISMDVTLEVENCFVLNVNAVGFFEFSDKITDENKKTLQIVNAPAIMFPYVRAFITTLTSNMGNSVKKITLPPLFFKGDIEVIMLNENNEPQKIVE